MSDEEKQISKNDVLFAALVRDFESMAMMGFGKLVDPVSRKAERNLDRAQIAIDMLGMLDDKTRGNLDAAQSALMRQVLTNLRLNFLDELEKEKKEREAQAAVKEESGPEAEGVKKPADQGAAASGDGTPASGDGAAASGSASGGGAGEDAKERAQTQAESDVEFSGEESAAEQTKSKRSSGKSSKRGPGKSSGGKSPGSKEV